MFILKDFRFWLLACIGSIYTYLIWSSQWISSDGLSVVYQSYNVINGLGLVWNLGERTYVSTSPLFTVTSIPLTYIFDLLFDLFKVSLNKIIYIPIIINLIFAITSIIVILKFSYSKIITFSTEKLIILILCFGLLLSSKFYIHFSTSGLENSLSYLVISIFTILAFKRENNKVAFLLPIFAALVFLTRYDFFIIIFPTMLYYLFKHKITKGLLIMSAIICCWFIFSFIYFGSIFPNSFYIKTRGYDFNQSLFYLKANLFESFSMFVLLGLGLYCSYFTNKKILIGTAFYLIYIFSVRDYMFGRLFTILLPISIISIIQFLSIKEIVQFKSNFLKLSFAALAVFITIFFVPSVVKLYSDKIAKGSFPLANERKFYTTKHNFFEINLTYNKPVKNVTSINTTGSMLDAPLVPENKNAYFIDPVGLASPFITYYIKNYGTTKGEKPGHSFVDLLYLKKIGLYETAIQNKNLLQNKNISELYNDVNIVSKGNIFDFNRLKTIIKLQTHKYNK